MLTPETIDFIERHLNDDVHTLALKPMPANSHIDLTAALQQIEGRQLAARKLPTWSGHAGLLFPPRLSMEQCSSERTALYKQALVERLLPEENDKSERHSMADLTGGFGIDFSFLAPLFKNAYYIEHNKVLCDIARHNLPLLGLPHAEVITSEAETYLEQMKPVDLLFADPARRDGCGHKTVAISDCTPNLRQVMPLIRTHCRIALFKLSPMLDTTAAVEALSPVNEVHVVSVDGECKELLTICGTNQPLHITCANLTHTGASIFTFTPNEEAGADCPFATQLQDYLYEPNASVMKACAFRSIAARFRLKKLHPNSHLYTADHLINGFPGRIFTIKAVTGFGKKELKQLAASLPKANLTVRNFPASVAELRKRLHINEGGTDYLFATTLHDNRHVLIHCHKAEYMS